MAVLVNKSRTPNKYMVRHYDYDHEEYTTDEHNTELLTGTALERHLEDTYHDKRAIRAYLRDMGIHINDVFDVVAGISPKRMNATQVRSILTDDNLAPFFRPFVEDGFREGFDDLAENWRVLIAEEIPVQGQTIQWYQLEGAKTASDYVLQLTGQGGEIPVSMITVSGKSVPTWKLTRGIEWTREAERAPVALAQIWLRVIGMRMGLSYWAMVVFRLRDGILDDGSDAPDSIPTAVSGTITLADLRRAKRRLVTTNGFPLTDIVINGDLLITLETATNTGGQLMLPNGSLAEALKIAPEAIHENDNLGTDTIIFMNRNATMVRYVEQEFTTEDDENKQKQTRATYASLIDQIVIAVADARVLLDANW